MMKKKSQPEPPAADPVALPCACASLRRAERAVTQIYERALRASGLRISQFTLLQVLDRVPGISQKRLGALLDLDSTTLTRTLAPLIAEGWLSSAPGHDRRELRLSLTPAGQRKLKSAMPAWESAQAKLRKALGGAAWERTQETLLRLTRAARQLR